MSAKPFQLGMFGAVRSMDAHLVAAHERMLADGTEVFVAEHLRWNRGRSEPRGRARSRTAAVSVKQESLFPSVEVEAVPPKPFSKPTVWVATQMSLI